MKMAEADIDDSSSHHEEEEEDFPPDFQEYMHRELHWSRLKRSANPDPDADLDLSLYSDSDWENIRWVFWSRQDNVVDKIKRALQKIIVYPHLNVSLVQFWAATTILEGETLLTTGNQPFALGKTDHPMDRQGLCQYRMISKDYKFYGNAYCEAEEIGLPGRVFLNKFPETTPNVKYYSIREYPQRYHALNCQVRQSWAVPVFKHSTHSCVGVLELVSTRESIPDWFDLSFLNYLDKVFQESSGMSFGLEETSLETSFCQLQHVTEQESFDIFSGLEEITMEECFDQLQHLMEQESSGMSFGLEETSFCQLQHAMEQLSICTRLCMRDSLYRIARNARHRNGGSISDGDNSGALMAEGTNESICATTDEKCVDRALAKLLFHRETDSSRLSAHNTMDSSVILAHDGLSLMTHIMCENENRAITAAFDELNMVLEMVCRIHKLPLALTWVQCSACDDLLRGRHIDYGDLNNAPVTSFLVASNAHHLRKCQGVVGRALLPPNLIYCSDVTQLNIAEYPLVHHARYCGFSGWFAICLKSTFTGDDFYVLEFFLPGSNKSSQKPWNSLGRILGTMKECFKTFKLASGEEMREELYVEVNDFQNGQKLHSVHIIQAARSLPGLEPLQNEGVIMQIDQTDLIDSYNNGRNVISAERNYTVVTNSEEGTINTRERKHDKTGVRIVINLEDILQASEMKRNDAARKLKVSPSTFKRVCREYGIPRWPPRDVNKVHPPQPSCVNQQDGIPQLNSDLPSNEASAIVNKVHPPQPSCVNQQDGNPQLNSDLPSNETSAIIAHTKPPDTAIQNGSSMTIKAKYVNDIMVKFQLPLPPKLVVLQQEVARRLNLEPGTYYVKYKDEEDDLILIGCDQDLKDCIHASRSVGSTSVIVLLVPK